MSDRRVRRVRVFPLARGEVEKLWPVVRAALEAERELWCNVFTEEVLKDRALRGQLQVWGVAHDDYLNILFMTQVLQTPASNILQVWWMWGEGLKEALEEISKVLERFAQMLHCDFIEVQGRRAFEKLLRPLGGKHVYSAFLRPVNRGGSQDG